METPARPPAFVLKLRLVSPTGKPFAKKRYRVKWGEKWFPQSPNEIVQTDENGALSVVLEGDTPRPMPSVGAVHVMDGDMVVWSIPLQICAPPPPVAMPELGIDEQPPEPPGETATQDEIRQYEMEAEKYRVLVLDKLTKDEKIVAFEQAWDGLRQVVSGLPGKIHKGISGAQLIFDWELFCLYFALVIHGYEAAWRLWNMNDLPLPEVPTFELLASDRDHLIRALERFARRHGLPPPPIMRQPSADMVEQCLKQVIEVHDRRGKVDPRIQVL